MPLVRIELMRGRPEDFGKGIGDIVYRAMVDAINLPEQDQFQVISEHSSNTLIYDPAYPDIPRTDGIAIIQITLSEGRSVELKQALSGSIAENLNEQLGIRNEQLGIRMEDVLINLIEVKKENWSFANGIAQYVV